MFSFFGKTLDESKLDRRKININTHLPVYITMSTIPSRLSNTLRIIENFMNNVTGFEKLILNVPYKYNRWPNIKELDLRHNINDGRFIINRCEDYGPLTKFLPVLENGLVPHESILIVCDDMCYQLDAFRDIAAVQDRRLYESFSYYVYPFKPKFENVSGFNFVSPNLYPSNHNKVSVNVPQGADLISMYTRNASHFVQWFNKLKNDLGVKSYFETPCFFVDDQVIGWYFQSQNIPMKQVERKHRNIYIKNCDKPVESDNLNNQKGKNSRTNTMNKCYNDLSSVYPLKPF